MELRVYCKSLLVAFLCVCIAAPLFSQCEARVSKQLLYHPRSPEHVFLPRVSVKHIEIDDPTSTHSNDQPYVSSPFSLPPFESLGPMPLPENTPPLCEDPPSVPEPPSTLTPTPTTTYSSPPPPSPTFDVPIQNPPPSPTLDVPIQNPPPSPTFDVPIQNPPPSPTSDVPSPPESSPIPNPPEYGPSPPSPTFNVPSPPEYVPSPPSPSYVIPGTPDYVPILPSPPSYAPGPPDYYAPSPPAIVPGTPIFGPSPPTYNPSPSGYTPSPTVFQPPVVYPPPSVPPPPYRAPHFALWCVVKPSVPDPIIQEAMNYACGSGADCRPIQENGPCYAPDTLFSHASYAFNSYWQRTKAAGGTCDFGGTGMLVTVDPSFNGCHFIYY
ncbi:hypothetical protein ACHQM5_004048 [Ranunculus cassubicifolius]